MVSNKCKSKQATMLIVSFGILGIILSWSSQKFTLTD